MAEDPGQQLNIQQEINKVLQKRQKLLADQTNMLTGQARIAKQLCKALDCQELDDLDEKLLRIKENDGIKQLTDDVKNSTEAISEASEQMSGLQKAAKLGALAGFIGGVKSAFGGALKTIRNTLGALGSIISTVGKVGLAIISIPFKMLNGLVAMSQEAAGGGAELRQAFEDVRKEFGDLNSNEGKAIKGTLKGLRGQMGNLAGTGLKMSRVFGYGREGMANFLKENLELASALGPAFNMLKNELSKNGVALAMYRKGLGLTAESQAAILANAKNLGKDPMKAMKNFADVAVTLGKKFNISSKVIGKNMGELVNDFEHFGNMAPETLGAVVTQAQRLGIEVKQLTGMMDKFASFDGAIDASSQLYQMFGMNVDAMKMMKSSDPGEQLAHLQKAFAKTGKSIDKMHFSQVKQLAGLVNMDSKTVSFALSQRGLSMSYKDVQKEMDKKHKKEKSQAEIMQDISKNIEKLVKQGQKKFQSFFDAFGQGFVKGIKRSKEFRKIFRNITKSLWVVYRAGKQVGKIFASTFPGMKKFAKGLAGIFDPKNVKSLMGKFTGAFKQLFLDLQKDPDAGYEKFFKTSMKAFTEYFGKSSKFGAIMIVGLKIIGRTLSGLIGQMIKSIGPLIAQGMYSLADIIRTGTMQGLSDKFDGSAFKPIVDALVEVAPAMWEAFKTLWDVIFQKMKPYLMTALKYYLGYIFGKFMLTVIASTITGTISSVVGAGIFKGGLGALFGGGKGGGGKPNIPDGIGDEGSQESAIKKAVGGFKKVISAINELKIMEILEAGTKLTVLAVSLLVPIGVFAAGLLAIIWAINKWGPKENVMESLMVLGTSIFSFVFIGKAIKKISMLSPAMMIKALLPLAALLLITAAVSLVMGLVMRSFSGVKAESMEGFAVGMAAFLGAMLFVGGAAIAVGALTAGPQAVLLALAVPGLAILAGVAVSTAGLILAFRSAMGNFSATQATVLEKTASATFNLVSSFTAILGSSIIAGGIGVWNSIKSFFGGGDESPVDIGIKQMTGLAETIGKFIPKIINSLASIKNPAVMTRTASAFGQVMKALAPMFNIASEAMKFATSAIIGNVDTKKIEGVFEVVNKVVGAIHDKVTVLIDKLSTMKITKASIDSAKAIAPLLTSAAAIMSAVTGPMEALANVSKTTRSSSYKFIKDEVTTDVERSGSSASTTFDTAAFQSSMHLVGKIMPVIINGLSGSITKLIRALSTTKLSKTEAKQVKRSMGAVGEVFKAMAAASGVVKDILGLPTSQAEKKEASSSGYSVQRLLTGVSSDNTQEVTKKGHNYVKSINAMSQILLGESASGVKDPKMEGGLLGLGLRFIDRLKGLTGKSPDFKIAAKNASGFSKVFNSFLKGFTVNTKKLDSAYAGISKMEEMVNMYDRIMNKLAYHESTPQLYESIVKLKEAFKVASKDITVLEPFKGGSLKVSHKVENINIKLSVNIDSKELAGGLIEVRDIGGTKGTGKRLALTPSTTSGTK